MPAIIGFVDDDCRAESYTLLWPVIQAKKIPYALACPPGHIGESKYLTKDQLLTMVNGGCEVLSHHWREYAMTEFQTSKAYEADVQKTLAMLADLGITNVRGVAYPNGYYNDSYMPIVRRYFDMGFTVERGINVPPVESCYMKRCELFPTNGAYTLEDAKQLVDEVAANGGWLIFMTHAWYTTFSADDLAALVDYIAEKDVDIVGMSEGMDTIGNVVDIGYARKPLDEMTTPYYIADCMGRIYANTWNYSELGGDERTEITLPYHVGYTLLPSGNTKSNTDTKRVISDKISAAVGERYLFCNLSAKYGNCFYVIYDANNAVLDYKGTDAASTGETLPDTEATMPENTAYFRLACDLGVNTTQFRAYKLTHTEAPASSSLPKGGTAGQVLVKKSDDDFDAEWASKITVLQTPLTGYTQDDLIGLFATGLIIVDGEYTYWIDSLTNGVLSGTGYCGITGKTYVFQKCRIKDGVFERIPESLVGLPSGGTAGQILAKNSSTVGDAQWIDLSDTVADIVTSQAIFGVNFSGSTSAGTRVGAAKDFVFTPGTDTSAGQNSFDAVYPWAGMRRCCCTLNADGTVKVNAYKGQPGYIEDGTNGEVLVEIPLFYVSGMLDVAPSISISMLPGYRAPRKFLNADGSLKQKCYVRAFPGSIGADGKLHSIAGVVPTSNQSITQFLAAARKWGDTYSIGTSADFEVLAYLMIIVYGTRHAQSKINGCVSLYSTNIAVATATDNAASVVVAKSASIEPGMVISIGTGGENETIARRRIVTSVEAIDGDTANVKVNFDGDPVTTTTDHKVWRIMQSTGTANSVLSTCGSPVSNTDGRHSFVFYGVENPLYGNQWRFECDWKLIDGVPYWCDDPTKYSWTSNDGYIALDAMAMPDEGWATALQQDDRALSVQVTKSVGGSSGTYLADYFWINKSGTRIARRGGSSSSGGGAGPFYVSLSDDAGGAWWSGGGDLSIPG